MASEEWEGRITEVNGETSVSKWRYVPYLDCGDGFKSGYIC